MVKHCARKTLGQDSGWQSRGGQATTHDRKSELPEVSIHKSYNMTPRDSVRHGPYLLSGLCVHITSLGEWPGFWGLLPGESYPCTHGKRGEGGGGAQRPPWRKLCLESEEGADMPVSVTALMDPDHLKSKNYFQP